MALTICWVLASFFFGRVQAFLVGKDFGALPAYEFALQHPGRTAGVACLGIPFSPVPFSFETTMPEGFYILRWGVRDVPPPPP